VSCPSEQLATVVGWSIQRMSAIALRCDDARAARARLQNRRSVRGECSIRPRR